jgi:uncharacterized protein YcbK (DUF882 family)
MAASGANAREKDRTLKLYFTHTGERGEFTYKRNGKFDPAALKKINHFLRDWRRNEPTKMDPRLLDIIWNVYREVGGREPIHVVSGYRSMKTNDMLRRRGRGAAKKSLHTRGQALDFFIPGVPVSKIRKAGLRLQRGGVGYYPKSGSPFVHLDTGSVRHWPRMTRKQLVAVFPKGGTLHVPTDGKPLPGYEVAKAKLKRGAAPTTVAYLDPQSRSIRPGTNASANADAKKATVGRWLKRTFAGGADEEEDNNLANPTTVKTETIVADSGEPAPLPRELPVPARRIALASLDGTDAAATIATASPAEQQAITVMASAGTYVDAAGEKTTLSERLSPTLPASQTQDQIMLSRLMAQAALRAETDTAEPAMQIADAASATQQTEPQQAAFTVASGPSPSPAASPIPSKRPALPENAQALVAGAAPQTAGSAINVAFNSGAGNDGRKTITVKTENTLALAYAGLGTGDEFGPRERPDPTMAVKPAREAISAPAVAVKADPLPSTAQSDEIIDRELPIRPAPAVASTGETIDFARFLGGETTRTLAFAGLEMPHPFAVPGFFEAPKSVKAASSYQSGQPLRFDRFAKLGTQKVRPESRIASVRVVKERFGSRF